MIQGSKEWLDFRRNKIGGSDAPIITGDSPWSNPLKLWRQKMGLEADTFKTAVMQRGIDAEPLARNVFIREMGIYVEPDVLISHNHDWQIASLDGISDDHKTILEIKRNGKVNHDLALKGQIPIYYQVQIQHQIAVCDAEAAYYMSYRDDDDYKIINVERDNAMIDKIIKAEAEFFRRMQEYDPPEDKAAPCKRCDLEDLEEAYVQAILAEKQAREEKERILSLLKEQADGKSFEGQLLQMTRYTTEGRVRYQDIPELKTIDLSKYRGPEVESWRVTLKKAE